MRVYLPIEVTELAALATGSPLPSPNRVGVVATAEFAATLETSDAYELDLLAALAASDLSKSSNVVTVLETEAFEVIDAELGEVRLIQPQLPLADFACLLIADVEAQELSWFGVQEIAELTAALARKG